MNREALESLDRETPIRLVLVRAPVIYPRFTQGIPFGRLAKLLSGILGLGIGAVRQLSAIPYQDRFARHEERA